MRSPRVLTSLAPVFVVGSLAFGCSGGGTTGTPGTSPPAPPGSGYTTDQTDFTSAPPVGQGGSRAAGGVTDNAAPSAPGAGGAGGASGVGGLAASTSAPRKVEETDLYRLEGDRLYYLNSYRGLMVFDVSNVDAPKLLGRSPIFGTPVEMVVRNGVATVVVADWFGTTQKGEPFHGSIVRGLDASNPSNIKVVGEALLGGWVQDTRVVGDVLYAVSEDYGWSYGWDQGYYGGSGGGVAVPAGGPVGVGISGGGSGAKVIVSSVSFGGNAIAQKSLLEFPGYGGVFNVTANSVLLAHDIPADPKQPYSGSSGQSELVYLDISDPGGTIKQRGSQIVGGSVQGWGSDNGRFNLDFADGKTAHLLAVSYGQGTGSTYVLSTTDFTNADHPKKDSEISIGSAGWIPAAHFDVGRMYLSPSSYYGGPNGATTPVQIYDLTSATAPKLAGSTSVQGEIWNFIPAGNKLFALGNSSNGNSSQVALRYLDVTNPTNPTVIGTAAFGDGWAWTPAAGTFKAFIRNDAEKLVVLPFSGWSYKSNEYNNGVQLIEYSDTSIRAAGAAKTNGWVERGIFVKGRVVSLSDLALSVVDYTNHDAPKVVSELTLARNIVDARPQDGSVAELSTDWWGNDTTSSELRVLPEANADETTDAAAAQTIKVDGTNARSFRNGKYTYVVSNVEVTVPCPSGGGGYGAPTPVGAGGSGGSGGSPVTTCTTSVPKVSVFEWTGSALVAHGTATLPPPQNANGYYGGGYGWYWYDWYDGSDAIQVNGSAIAFRRWQGYYQVNGKYFSDTKLYVVDLRNADAPAVATTVLSNQDDAWWGNMRAVGGKLYVTHYEWVDSPWLPNATNTPRVKYYLDPIDLTDPSKPTVENRINVPGFLVGGSETDPSLLYTVNYRWESENQKNDLAVVKIDNGKAHLQSWTVLDGYVGNVIVRGSDAFSTVQKYPDYSSTSGSGGGVAKGTTGSGGTSTGPTVTLHQFDFSDPKHPVDHVASGQSGWGWLLGVEGDRALVTSGWGNAGVDMYKLAPGAAPTFDRYVRTQGWGAESLARDKNSLFISSGYWGVQRIDLQ